MDLHGAIEKGVPLILVVPCLGGTYSLGATWAKAVRNKVTRCWGPRLLPLGKQDSPVSPFVKTSSLLPLKGKLSFWRKLGELSWDFFQDSEAFASSCLSAYHGDGSKEIPELLSSVSAGKSRLRDVTLYCCDSHAHSMHSMSLLTQTGLVPPSFMDLLLIGI